MGGYIRVVIRDEDGSVWSNRRHTNAMPTFTRDVRFIDNDEAWFERYKGNGQCHNDDHTLAPVEYGILVVDRKTKTVIDCNGYGRALAFPSVTLATSEGDPDYEALQERGLLLHDGKPLEIPADMTLAQYVQTIYDAGSHSVIKIDAQPWTDLVIPEGNYQSVREKMEELGFEFTARDSAAFTAEMRSRNGEAHEDIASVLDRLAKTDADIICERVSAASRAAERSSERTYTIDIWDGESIWSWEGNAFTEAEAEAAAVDELNDDWGRSYAKMAELRADVDGVALLAHAAVMSDREPLARVEARVELCDMVRTMIGDGRLASLSDDDRKEMRNLVQAAFSA